VLGIGKWLSGAPAETGGVGGRQRVGRARRKRLYFRIERVGRVWDVSVFFNQSRARKEYVGKNELVVEGMSKYDCPEGIAGS